MSNSELSIFHSVRIVEFHSSHAIAKSEVLREPGGHEISFAARFPREWGYHCRCSGSTRSRNLLSVQGFVFDTIIDVAEDWFQTPKAISSWDMKWLKWHALYEEDPPRADPYGSDDAREEAYWRTLVADSDGEGGKAPDEFGDCFRIWRYWGSHYGVKPGGLPTNKLWLSDFDFTQLPELTAKEKAYVTFLEQMFATVRRKLFKTQRGYIGLGSWAVQPRWSVCTLHGGNFPILAQGAGILTIKSLEKSENSRPNQIFEGGTDAETRKAEELSVAGDNSSGRGGAPSKRYTRQSRCS